MRPEAQKTLSSSREAQGTAVRRAGLGLSSAHGLLLLILLLQGPGISLPTRTFCLLPQLRHALLPWTLSQPSIHGEASTVLSGPPSQSFHFRKGTPSEVRTRIFPSPNDSC